MSKKLTIGLFGFGCVGTGLYEVLNKTELLDAKIDTIVVKTKGKQRIIAESNFSYDKDDILKNDNINVVVELIDDAEAALKIVTQALNAGKNVVSANKKMIAENMDRLITLAKENNVSFLYEAAVCAAIPIIRNLEEYYNNDSLSGLEGICNGTTNYILTQTNIGKDYATALSEASDLGFAESDPTLDVDGFDSKFKLQILIKHSFGLTLDPKDIFNYGIRHVKPKDVQYALEKNFRIKLFSKALKIGDKIYGFVAPHFIKKDHNCYNVSNEFNAVTVEALFSDKQMFEGKGAGSYPTASAVLTDISALQYDYKYGYKKESFADKLTFEENFNVRVYIGSANKEALRRFNFLEKDEVFQSKSYNYITGKIEFNEIKKFDLNKESDLFLAFLPEELSPISKTINIEVEPI